MPPAPRPLETVATPDGIALALRRWEAASTPVRGTLLLVHGLGEHSGRYAHVARFLNGRGWKVIAYDHRGHGASLGARGSVPHGETLVDDLALVVDRVARAGAVPGSPLVLLGHSLGGLIAALFVARSVRPVEGLVLSSPALAVHLTPFQRLQLRVGRALLPDLAVRNQLRADRLSHDAAVVRAYRADPLVHDRITPRLANATLRFGREARAAAPQWRVPTLLLWSGDDALVASEGSDAFAAAAPPAMVRCRRFDSLWHEILNEADPAEVYAALGSWLDERYPAR